MSKGGQSSVPFSSRVLLKEKKDSQANMLRATCSSCERNFKSPPTLNQPRVGKLPLNPRLPGVWESPWLSHFWGPLLARSAVYLRHDLLVNLAPTVGVQGIPYKGPFWGGSSPTSCRPSRDMTCMAAAWRAEQKTSTVEPFVHLLFQQVRMDVGRCCDGCGQVYISMNPVVGCSIQLLRGLPKQRSSLNGITVCQHPELLMQIQEIITLLDDAQTPWPAIKCSSIWMPIILLYCCPLTK